MNMTQIPTIVLFESVFITISVILSGYNIGQCRNNNDSTQYDLAENIGRANFIY